MKLDRILTNCFAPAFLVLLCVVVGTAQSRRVAPEPTPTPPGEDVERIVTEEVKLNVLAFNEDGGFFMGVGENDLVITENNILHQPSSVRRIPANVLIVMDTGGELRSVKSLDHTRRSARALVAALRPEDTVAVLQYGDSVEIVQPWTSDRSEAMRSIGRTKFGRRSVFTDALRRSRDLLMTSGLDNKHMVLITDGTDSTGNIAAKAEALRSMLASDISVHVVSYTGMEAADIEPRTKGVTNSPPPKAMPDMVAAGLPPGVKDVATSPRMKTIIVDRKHLKTMRDRKADLLASEQQLSTLAENTNGEFIVPGSLDEMIDKMALVAKMIDSSYVVTYTPKVPIAEAGGERSIVVTSKRPGLIVEARRKLVVESRE